MLRNRKKLTVANFKMSLNMSFEVNNWMENFKKATDVLDLRNGEIVLCPPIGLLDKFVQKIEHQDVAFGAQNCFWEQKGAFTGENSPVMIKSLGGKYVILGHSERREFFGETNDMINLKLKMALKSSLTPILCIGESGEEKKKDFTLEAIKKQFYECLAEISSNKMEEIVLCYEPIWAISANNPDHLPDSNEIMEARLLIKKLVMKYYGEGVASKVRILYGGSVKGDNVEEVCVKAGMDGALIGGASLLPYDLARIAKILDN
jgi:triosephosphate isomerase (TIM)